jgi:ketosteroid isomerase-like protein
MPPKDIEDARALATELVDALNARDLERLMALTHPEIEFHSRFIALEGGVYKGHAGMSEYFRDIEAAFVNARWEIDEIVGWRGDELVIVIRTTGNGRESGVPIDTTTPQVWTFRDGMPWRNVTYSSVEEALNAAVVPE